ncbi:LytR/AlgR family response regulator transcription factor [Neolewinella aurantiaca]|uniref:LytR/AlgR family response regulator transcription factor n=1 Tax=Neolewinella aurantiaca TaxID=2602767 RepID=UPI001FE87A6C|nr:LytTR family DNA-binding domain-containing protein [Neolewinella aurantiaca]
MSSTSNTISALIIDDEPLAHQIIEAYAKDLDFLTIVGTCHRATQAYSLLSEKEVDLIFLDINMPELQGLDFLRTLERKPRVIITSAFEEYAIESFELQVSDYLLKPFRFTRFLRAVNKVRSELGGAAGASEGTEAREDHLFVKVDRQYRRVELADIHYLESYGNYVKIWTGDSFLLTTRTLSGMMEELPSADFLKIHKSYVVRKALVDYLEGNQLVMKNTQVLPVGKLQRDAVREWVKG